jgi:UDP-N-acetylglucosamine 4-epimerase
MKIAGFRYFNVFGPRQDPDGPYAAVIPLFINSILKQAPFYINGDGEQTRDFTFVENAVQANIKGMLTDDDKAFGQVYNVAVGANFSVNFLYKAISDLLSIDHKPVYREARSGDIRDSLADISKASQLLKYKPTQQFLEGLKMTVNYFKGA